MPRNCLPPLVGAVAAAADPTASAAPGQRLLVLARQLAAWPRPNLSPLAPLRVEPACDMYPTTTTILAT